MLVYRERTKHYIWNGVVMASATFMALYIPLNLKLDTGLHTILEVCYWLAWLVFGADLVVNLMRNKRIKGNATTEPKPLLSYAGFWFWVDLIAAIPFRLMFGGGILQLLHLVKLIRVTRFFRELKQSELRFAIGLTLISFLFWTALLVHWLVCGWMSVYGLEAASDNTTNYISALYWVVTTLTAVGYGDIVPLTNVQRLYAMLVQVAGIGVFGYLIGSVVNILSKMDAVKAKYVENVELLTTAIRRRGLPPDLQKRILDYYTYLRDEKMGYDESVFLESLPDSLKTEVALHLKKEFIESIPLFKHASEQFIIEIALKLKYSVATPGDYIFKAGDPGQEMYFIIQGALDVLTMSEDQVLTQLKDGDFFGEIALFESQPRSATVKANEYCNLYKLQKETFEEVMAEHPEIARQIKEKARSRAERDFEV